MPKMQNCNTSTDPETVFREQNQGYILPVTEAVYWEQVVPFQVFQDQAIVNRDILQLRKKPIKFGFCTCWAHLRPFFAHFGGWPQVQNLFRDLFP